MKNLSASIIIFLGMVTALLSGLSGCTIQVAGGSSEIGNGRVAGAVANRDGGPAAGTLVQLIPADYIPYKTSYSRIYEGDAGQNGSFTFDRVDTGMYNFEAISDSGKVFVRNIHIASGQNFNLGTMKLVKTGSLIVNLPGQLITDSSIIYMEGTSYQRTGSMLAGTDQGFLLDSLPAGVMLPSIVAVTDNMSNDEEIVVEEPVIRESVVLPAQYLDWNHYSGTRLLTGNHLFDDNLPGFPVLVRLDTSNFDFLSCKPDGSDIRTVNEFGMILHCEVEYLDIPRRSGALWVALDSLDGNSDDQKIVVLWGNTAAQPVVKGAVFDTSFGYCGVWHFNDAQGSGIFTDATYLHNNGMDSTNATGRTGIIGMGKEFNGNNDRVVAQTVPLMISDNQFTISLWMKVQDLTDTVQRILVSTRELSLTTDNVTLSCKVNPLAGITFKLKFADTIAYQTDISADTLWHAVSVTSDNGTISIYVDGARKSQDLESIPRTASVKLLQLLIGGGNGNSFKGFLDEVRVERVVRSLSWIWYSYDSQQIGSRTFFPPR